MINAKKGDWVQIHRVILEPGQRPDTLPECTKTVPYEGWIKGFLINTEAAKGDEVQIETLSGRAISGTLVSVNPTYDHGFGKPQKELLSIGRELRRIVKD
jgi:2-amino-4-ketopentanoate thiolase alpha subunit